MLRKVVGNCLICVWCCTALPKRERTKLNYVGGSKEYFCSVSGDFVACKVPFGVFFRVGKGGGASIAPCLVVPVKRLECLQFNVCMYECMYECFIFFFVVVAFWNAGEFFSVCGVLFIGMYGLKCYTVIPVAFLEWFI